MSENPHIEGVAAIAYTMCEMGDASDGDVMVTVAGHLERRGLLDPDNVRLVADAVTRIPQPEDRTPEETEQRRPIEEMLGLPSAEHQLNAQLRARELVLKVIDHLEPR